MTTRVKQAMKVVEIIGTLESALQMIEQGYVFRGSEKVALDAEGMRTVAREALRFDAASAGEAHTEAARG